jgi:hypothetical protein
MRRFYSVHEYRGNLLTCVFAEKHGKIANPLVRVERLSTVDFATVRRPQLLLKALQRAAVDTVVALDHTLVGEAPLDYALRPPSG